MKNFLNSMSYVSKYTVLFIALTIASVTTYLSIAQSVDTYIQGDVTVKNVTSGSTIYTESVITDSEDVVRFKVRYYNTELSTSGLVAQNMTVVIDFPDTLASTHNVAATIKGDNTNTIYDSAAVSLGTGNSRLEYIPGTAKWQRNTGGRGENINYEFTNLNDNVVTDGVPVVLGDIQPSYDYEGFVYFDAKITEQAGPIFECTSLSTERISPISWKFTASSKVENTNLEGYLWKVDGKVVQEGASDMYTFNQSKPGKYTVTAQVVTKDGTTDVNKVCSTTVEVKEKPTDPIYECTSLTAVQNASNRLSWTFTTKVNKSDNVSVNKYIYNFGDGSDKFSTDQNQVTKVYKDYGKYIVDVEVVFNVGDGQKSDSCSTSVEMLKTPPVTPPVTPTPPPAAQLPNTGPAEVLAGVSGLFGAGALSYGAMSLRASNKGLRDTLLGKKKD